MAPANVGTFPAAKIRGNASTVMLDSCCLIRLKLPVAEFDNAGLHDLDNDALIAPIDGVYVVSAAVTWQNPANEPAVGTRAIALRKGTFTLAWDEVAAAESSSDIQGHSVSALAKLQAGDSVTLEARQQGGGANEQILVNAGTPWLAMAWIGPG